MIDWKQEHLVAFVALVRDESRNVPAVGSGVDGRKAMEAHQRKIAHHLHTIEEAFRGDEHARANIMTILQAREVIDGS